MGAWSSISTAHLRGVVASCRPRPLAGVQPCAPRLPGSSDPEGTRQAGSSLSPDTVLNRRCSAFCPVEPAQSAVRMLHRGNFPAWVKARSQRAVQVLRSESEVHARFFTRVVEFSACNEHPRSSRKTPL